MMLVEEDKVRLEDPITKYFTEAPQRWRGITIRHLLTHTSGIQNHVAVPHWLDVFRTNLAFETTPSRDELLKMFFKLPLEFQAGETWAYDNTGYYLLGIIIEKASGKSYWQFLDERIFKPLGMNSTTYLWLPGANDRLVAGHRNLDPFYNRDLAISTDKLIRESNQPSSFWNYEQEVFSPQPRTWQNGMPRFTAKSF